MTAATKLKDAFSWKKSYDKPRQCITKQGHHFADKGPYRQSCGFSMYGYEGWTIKRRLRAEELILSNYYITTRKTTDLTIWIFVGKAKSLLFSMLSRFVIAFLLRSKHLFISWLLVCAIAQFVDYLSLGYLFYKKRKKKKRRRNKR